MEEELDRHIEGSYVNMKRSRVPKTCRKLERQWWWWW